MSDTIYREILRRLKDSDDSVAEMISRHGIQVRDIVILSIVCNQGIIPSTRLAELLGFTQSVLNRSQERLISAELLSVRSNGDAQSIVRATAKGMQVAIRFDQAATCSDEA